MLILDEPLDDGELSPCGGHEVNHTYFQRAEDAERARLLDKQHRLLARVEELREEKQRLNVDRAGPQKAPPPLHAFWTNLGNAEVDNDGFLQLTEGTNFFGREGRKSQRMDCIYVRQWYRRLYEHIVKLVKPESKRVRRVVVTGGPGTGKTYFGFYCLWQLCQAGKTVIYQWGSDFYRFSGKSAEYGSENAFVSAGYFRDKDCWFLADPESHQSLRSDCLGITLVLHSRCFRNRVYDEFMKARRGRTAAVTYMSPWSLNELQKCRARKCPHLTRTEVEDLSTVWGGSAWLVLKLVQAKSRRMLLDTIHTASMEKWEAALADALAPTHKVFGKAVSVADFVVQMVPITPETFTTQFVSGYIFQLFSDRHQAAMRARVRDWLAAALGSPAATTPGNMFELLAHNDLLNSSAYNDVFKYTRLVSGETPKERRCRPLRREEMRFSGHHRFGVLADLEVVPDTYYWPLQHDVAAVDAFAVIGDALYMFKMTTNERRGAPAEGVIAVV
ncbi:hypothetical protein JKP88DRAFT_311660 [Tribonema minus]|uniref:Crinkler (CRN) family protein n=1 Tax=Tribonema minus TaxID=303371 RepID=A0A835Z2C9_9STRA|nr:hypothetical protein JKP88DRAFT_311660 [Tribonema minus]